MKKIALSVLVVLFAALALAQNPSAPPAVSAPPAAGAVAPAAPGPQTAAKVPDKGQAYYHYTQAHIYEELVSIYGRTEFAQRAVQEYRLAIENDPDSEYLNEGLAELYAKTGRIREAVEKAQAILARDPKNVDAHKLLGRIYLRSLGDLQAGTQSQEVLRLAVDQFEQISKLEPANSDNFLLLGRLYRLDNQMGKAEEVLKHAIQLDPGSEEAVTTLAYLYTEEGDNARAVATLNAVADKSTKVWSALGYTYEQQHDYKQAVAAYRAAVEDDKDNLDALRGLAQNLLNDGQTQAALEQYKLIAEADPQDAQAFLRMAEIHRRAGRFDLALENLKKAGTLAQDSVEVAYNLALVYEAQGKFDEAVAALAKLLDQTAKEPAAYAAGERNNRAVFLERLGAIYREQGKYQLAVETYRKLLDLGGDNVAHGYGLIIEAHRDAKQWDLATAVAREAVAKLPGDKDLRLTLDAQLADSGLGEQAIADVKTQFKGGPDDRETYVALSQIYRNLRRWKEAEDALDQAAKLASKPEEKNYVDYVRGALYEREKKYDAAEEVFRRILARDPQNTSVLNYLGYMLADRGLHLEEALGYVKKAVELEPQNGAFLDSLGWAYFKLGKYEMAEESLRRAAEKMSNDGTVLDHLGDLYQKTGRLRLAAAHWERALEAWNKTIASEVEPTDVARTQRKLESARVRLAQQQNLRKPQ